MSHLHHKRWLLFLALAGLAAFALGAALLARLPEPAQPMARAGTPSILITDRQGRPLYEMIDAQGSKFVPLALDDVPTACRQATIATEDSRFFLHPGVDPLAIVRAAWLNLLGGHTVSGGSTLTQQLARNLYLGSGERTERSLKRKLREAWLALQLERHYNKNEILALYLNTTYYGHFATGIEAAAQAYFGVHAGELDLAQCALLAGLPQYPAGYNPTENPDAARGRQATVLALMVKHGYIGQAQAADAAGERLAFASSPFPIEAPHFVMWVQSQLESLLPEGRLAAVSQEGGGLRVETTLDLDWQQQAEAIVSRRLAQLQPCAARVTPGCDPAASSERRVDDAALVALDPGTGAVLAMVGSADYFNPAISGAVNAALAHRQPGSAIKPLTYSAAFDPARSRAAGQEPWTPATLIADVRTVFPTEEGRPYVPNNYDMRYHGPVTARAALANSYNIPAVKALQRIGLPALIEQANRLGIGWRDELAPARSAAPDGVPAEASPHSLRSFGLALTLGGGEVRLLDLTAAYAAFANGGYRVTPYAIRRVATASGQVLIENGELKDTSLPAGVAPTRSAPVQVLDPRVAYLITDILSDDEARMPSFGEGSALAIDRPAAAKTGTTTDWRDNWTLGYTPDLVTGVWVGNANNAPMQDISGITGAGPIWHDFMQTALRATPPREFSRPAGLVQVEVCADSGLLPLRLPGLGDEGKPIERVSGSASSVVPSSPDPGSGSSAVPCPARRREWFIAGTEPTQVDTMHRQVAVDVRTGQAARADTPAEATYAETFWLLPAEYQDWARATGFPQPTVDAGWLPVSGQANAAGAPDAGQAGGSQPDGARAGSPPGAVVGWTGPAASDTARRTAQDGASLAIISPEPGRAYRIDHTLPPGAQQVPVVVRAGDDLAASGVAVELLVDGAPIGSVTAPDYTAWWTLTPGRHTIEARARANAGKPQSASVVVTVAE